MNKDKKKYLLLVIDADRTFCDSIKKGLQSERIEVLLAHDRTQGLAACARRKVDVLLLAQEVQDRDGQLLCPAILKYNDKTKIIFITAHPGFNQAVNAIKAGAYDYLSKPVDMGKLRLTVRRSIDTLELERFKDREFYRNGKVKEDSVLVGSFGEDSQVRSLIEKAAKEDSPVLVTGETGTGKNLVARLIHYASGRREPPFIGTNCAAVPGTRIEDELFGREKGTDSDARFIKKGVFELAGGGTLFLDEIDVVPLHLQSKLLNVLDEKQIRRTGGQALIPVNVRIISATPMDPEQLIRERNFRQDLYRRLSVIRIYVPPLRRRIADIPLLCDYFISRLAPHKEVKLLDGQLNRLMKYQWPGNVRELRNVIERSILLHGDRLRPSELIELRRQPLLHAPGNHTYQLLRPLHQKTLEEIEIEHIRRVLDAHSYNYTHSARTLGISLSTLKRRIKQFIPDRRSRDQKSAKKI
jgi:DNA-binding NtrC family response regulator